ncbi:MAG: hypothetical protein HQL69_08535 [Magnetococcales bacterium]|nr:hypothetical protein [Magnetococcales bacterium]
MQKIKYLFFVFSIHIFISLSSLGNAEATFKLCQDIVDHCNSASVFEVGLCVGYLEAVADNGEVGVCIPENTTPKQLTQKFINWAQTNQRGGIWDAYGCVAASMIDSFPCKGL